MEVKLLYSFALFASDMARFQDCCSRALVASVRLASKVSGFSEEAIEEKYRQAGFQFQ